MIRCVVFDFDGTLVESNHIKRQTFFELASEFDNGMRLMEDVMSEADGRERHWIFARFAAALPGQADAKTLADRYTRICQERIASAPEIAGARVSLKHLRTEGKLLFVNSATPVEPLTSLVRLRRLDAMFEGIYGSPAKKHENLEAIRSKHGLTPDEILVVGDGESDRASAKTLGCHFVAVDSAENDFTLEPPCRIPDLTGLPAVVATNRFLGDRK
jgi:phosphoglycolate phosphatase